MGLFGKIVQATIKTASLPVAVVKDVCTLGGAITDNRGTYTGERLSEIKDKAEEIYDSLDD